MSTSVSKYFSGTKGGNKRKQSSTSSASDSALSPTTMTSEKSKQTQKKQKQDGDSDKNSDSDMDLKDALQDIKDTLLNMVTKDDIETLRSEMLKLTTTLSTRIDQIEGRMFDIQKEKDSLSSEVEKLKGVNKEIKDDLSQKVKQISSLRRDFNDNEQHGRQWNVRVFGIPEGEGETVEDCVQKCVDVFNKQVGVTSISTNDVEIAHRAGRQGMGGRPRPILLRFISRRQRGKVLAARRRLKGSGISVGEDLTQSNYQLLRRVTNHSATMSAWTSNGKVLTKLKNGKIIKVDVDTDVDAVFRREMS